MVKLRRRREHVENKSAAPFQWQVRGMLKLTMYAGADPRFFLEGSVPLKNYYFNNHFYDV